MRVVPPLSQLPLPILIGGYSDNLRAGCKLRGVHGGGWVRQRAGEHLSDSEGAT